MVEKVVDWYSSIFILLNAFTIIRQVLAIDIIILHSLKERETVSSGEIFNFFFFGSVIGFGLVGVLEELEELLRLRLLEFFDIFS